MHDRKIQYYSCDFLNFSKTYGDICVTIVPIFTVTLLVTGKLLVAVTLLVKAALLVFVTLLVTVTIW